MLKFIQYYFVLYITDYEHAVNVLDSVMGTFHEGNIHVFPPETVRKQCVPNCVVATTYTMLVPIA